MENYFSKEDILASATATLEEINVNLSGVCNPSKINKGISEAINQAIVNGQGMALHWKALNPQTHQYQHLGKFPSALFECMDTTLLESLQKRGIHIYNDETGSTTIKVTYTW